MNSQLFFVSKDLTLKEANQLASSALMDSEFRGRERLPKKIDWSCGTKLTVRHKNYWIYYFD